MKKILLALMCAISIISFNSCGNNNPVNPQLQSTKSDMQKAGTNITYNMRTTQYRFSDRYHAIKELTKWHSDFLHTAFISLNNVYHRTTPLENITYNVNQSFDNYLVFLGEGESAFVRDVNRFEEVIEIYPLIEDEEEKAQLIVNLFPVFDTIVNTIPSDITSSNITNYLLQEVFNTSDFQAFNVDDQNILLIMLTTYEDSYKYWTEHLPEIDDHFGSWHNASEEMVKTLAKADAAGAVGGLVTKGFRCILTAAGRAAIRGFYSGLLLGGIGAIPGAFVSLSVNIATEIVCCAAGASIAKWIEKDRLEQETFNQYVLMRPTYDGMLSVIDPYLPE